VIVRVVTGAALIGFNQSMCNNDATILVRCTFDHRRKKESTRGMRSLYTLKLYCILASWLRVNQLVDMNGISFFFRRLVTTLSMIIGFEHLRYGEGALREIPESWKSRLTRLIRGITDARGAFLTGSVVTLFEVPCTVDHTWLFLGY